MAKKTETDRELERQPQPYLGNPPSMPAERGVNDADETADLELDEFDELSDFGEVDEDDPDDSRGVERALHPADRRGMSGDAGGLMAPVSDAEIDQDYSGAGSGMDDESAGTTNRAGIGGGAGYSTSRNTMADVDGITSLEADLSGDEERDAQPDDDVRSDRDASLAGKGRGGSPGRDEDGADSAHNQGVGFGASDVGATPGGMTDDDIRSGDDPRVLPGEQSLRQADIQSHDQERVQPTSEKGTTARPRRKAQPGTTSEATTPKPSRRGSKSKDKTQ